MSSLQLIFGNKNYSSWSLRPWILMKHYQVPFEEKRIPLFTDESKQVLSQHYSNGKVPVLMDGDFEVWDSLAILEYISEQYLDGKGWPQNTKARAIARAVSAEMHSSFVAVRNEMPMNCRKQFQDFTYSATAQADVDRICSIWEICRSTYGHSGDWLFGEFSIADAMFAPIALRFHSYCIELTPSAQTYVTNILNHPHIQDWIEAGKTEEEVIGEDEA